MSNKLKVFTAFSGYDSQCLALKRLSKNFPDFDFELVGWSEIDPYAIKAHNVLFPEYADRNFGDISKVDWKDVENFDLLTYSSPCFVAGTKVITDTGYKCIEDIKENDLVLTHTGKFKRVLRTMCRIHKNNLVEITANRRRKVVCTPNHPFYVNFKSNENKYDWVSAQHLDPKIHNLTYFYNSNDEFYWAIINNLKIIENKSVEVYNLEVEDDSSYTANNFIVHNCTDFSLAGKQMGGEEGSGTRSSLLWEVKRCIEAKRPKYLLLENVTGLVSGKFKPLFEKWMETVAEYGYENFWSVLNAKKFGIPQNRERVFLVSIRKDNEDIINYNFPNESEVNCKIEDILEPGPHPEKYYINQEKVDEYVRENEERIKNYVYNRQKKD